MTTRTTFGKTELARRLNKRPAWVDRQIELGNIVPWMWDTDHKPPRPVFTQETIDAHMRRVGELAAERRAS